MEVPRRSGGGFRWRIPRPGIFRMEAGRFFGGVCRGARSPGPRRHQQLVAFQQGIEKHPARRNPSRRFFRRHRVRRQAQSPPSRQNSPSPRRQWWVESATGERRREALLPARDRLDHFAPRFEAGGFEFLCGNRRGRTQTTSSASWRAARAISRCATVGGFHAPGKTATRAGWPDRRKRNSSATHTFVIH